MSKRVYLPVLQTERAPDRRLVLRGLAASVLATLSGCQTGVRDPSRSPDAGVDAFAPDAFDRTGLPVVRTPSPGYSLHGNELRVHLAHSANTALQTIGGARIITIGGWSYMLLRMAADEVVTLSAICTHEQCLVGLTAARTEIECPCHGSRFGLDGEVLAGPAEEALAMYATSYDAATQVARITL